MYASGVQVIQSLRDKPKAWHLGFAGALISQEREYKALREVKNMKVSLGHSHSPDLVCVSDRANGLACCH